VRLFIENFINKVKPVVQRLTPPNAHGKHSAKKTIEINEIAEEEPHFKLYQLQERLSHLTAKAEASHLSLED